MPRLRANPPSKAANPYHHLRAVNRIPALHIGPTKYLVLMPAAYPLPMTSCRTSETLLHDRLKLVHGDTSINRPPERKSQQDHKLRIHRSLSYGGHSQAHETPVEIKDAYVNNGVVCTIPSRPWTFQLSADALSLEINKDFRISLILMLRPYSLSKMTRPNSDASDGQAILVPSIEADRLRLHDELAQMAKSANVIQAFINALSLLSRLPSEILGVIFRCLAALQQSTDSSGSFFLPRSPDILDSGRTHESGL
ncbi:hypothetical protein EVG20_g11651 [Dentipellis fragilis]|uniref:Uncharacterized protein n=1 Tax=Dentipellis fragilis TaxID=205917 RepID=A0A4Y9XJU2_9AGAM|nr:hypothetical protein EVG20_g11651 [Dentipellis fragilis]